MVAAHNKKNPRRTAKSKLLLDENFSAREELIEVNQYCNVRHICRDLKICSLGDDKVYELACQQSRLLVTFNLRHFKPLVRKDTISVIGISARLNNDQIDKKLLRFIKSLKPDDCRGKCFYISGETRKRAN